VDKHLQNPFYQLSKFLLAAVFLFWGLALVYKGFAPTFLTDLASSYQINGPQAVPGLSNEAVLANSAREHAGDGFFFGAGVTLFSLIFVLGEFFCMRGWVQWLGLALLAGAAAAFWFWAVPLWGLQNILDAMWAAGMIVGAIVFGVAIIAYLWPH